MDDFNLWLNIAGVIGVAIIGYGGWKALASKTAIDTISLLKEELNAVRSRLDSFADDNKELRKQNGEQAGEIKNLTVSLAEYKAENRRLETVIEQQNANIGKLQQAVGRLARRLEVYEGQEPIETIADEDAHQAVNRVTVEQLRADVRSHKPVIKADTIQTNSIKNIGGEGERRGNE